MTPNPGKPLHVLHIIESLDPAYGGPIEALQTLLAFAPANSTSEVVTLDPPGAPFLATLPFPVHALGPTRSNYGYSPRLLPWLKQNRHRFDGVIVNGLWQYCGLATWLAFRGRKPYVVFSHGMLDPYFKRAFPRKHAKKWVYWLIAEYWVLRGAFRVLFTTEAESHLAKQSFWLHRWNGLVVPLGTRRPPPHPEALCEAFYGYLPALRGKRVMLFLGRIHRKKGCDLLIHAFLKYAALDPGLHLLMAGPDEQNWSAELKSLAEAAGLSERIHWPGMLEGDVKWGALYASEVFILPSHQENFGIAVAEALACGRPVLLADKVNIAPEIAADHAGFMQPDTQPGTDTLVKTWIELPQPDRDRMSVRALETFNKRYDMQQNAAAIFHLFAKQPPKS